MNSTHLTSERLCTIDAIKRFWVYYLGLVFFWPLAFAWILASGGIEENKILCIGGLAVLFFGSGLLAAYPWLKGKVKYGFWIVACVIWLFSGPVWWPTLGALSMAAFPELFEETEQIEGANKSGDDNSE